MVDIKENNPRYIPSNRKIQGLEQENTIPIVNIAPKDNEGRNGDMLIVIEPIGTPVLYFKAKNSWHIATTEAKKTEKKRYAPVGQPNNPTSAGVHDTGWFGVNDSNDATILKPRPGTYAVAHNLSSDLVTTSVFCRFEGLRDGANHLYVIDLNSHISNSGPNANRYGYWVEIIDNNTIEFHINPDGLSIIYSETLSDTSSNQSTLISSSDSTNIGAIELRVFVSPVTDENNKKIRMETLKSDNKFNSTSDKSRISTGNNAVNNLGAKVDGTKNDSFSIDSDGTGVLLKNNSGILRVRNLADSSDADVQCSSIKDSNGKKVIDIAAASSAVNFIKNTNSATTAAPSITPEGDDDNIGITVKPKGEGDVFLQSAGSNSHIQFLKSDSTVKAQLDVTSNTPELKLLGSAADIGHLDTDVNGVLRLWNISDGSAGHLKISAKDTLYLNAGDGTIYLNTAGESTAGTFAEGTPRALFSFATADKAILTSITNDDMQVSTLGSGNVELNPATGVTKFLKASDADDLCTVTVAANGETTIATVDSDGSAGHLNLDVNGDIILDTDSGNFIAKKGGTEFSAANSAYAGMILGYTQIHNLSSLVSWEIQNSMTVEDDTHKISFKTPPSENVEIEVTAMFNVSSTDTKVCAGLSTANATDGYSAVHGSMEYDSAGIMFSDDEANDHVKVFKFVVGASYLEAVGADNTFWLGFSTAGSTKTVYLQTGFRSSHGIASHPLIIKATALPATIYDGT